MATTMFHNGGMPALAPPPQHVYHGDYFAQAQMGGNVGGHGNHNSIFNGGADSMQSIVDKVDIQLKANALDRSECFMALSDIMKTRSDCEKLLERCRGLEKQLCQKAGVAFS